MQSTQPHPYKACVIQVIDPHHIDDRNETLDELRDLINTVGGVIIIEEYQKKAQPDYKTYIGSGKVEEIIAQMKHHDANLLIVGNILKPKQTYTLQTHLDKAFGTNKVLVRDKIDLILKIFEKHAQTAESKMQISLAALDHMGPRIFGMGMEMSRQGGGSKLSRGLGETNTERMKRHLKEQKRRIEKKLAEFATMRQAQRARRKRNNGRSVGIVGYTNAGKSSLINALSSKKMYAADKLFATLGTKSAPLILGHHPDGSPRFILLHDTIGFIRDLPPSLIQSFRSTLEDSLDTDMLLHVIDASDPHRDHKYEIVETILNDIGSDVPRTLIFSKSDLIDTDTRQEIMDAFPDDTVFFVSSETDEGLDALRLSLADAELTSKAGENNNKT